MFRRFSRDDEGSGSQELADVFGNCAQEHDAGYGIQDFELRHVNRAEIRYLDVSFWTLLGV